MPDDTGGSLDRPADGDPDPQRPTPVPAAEIALGAVGQRAQGRGLRTGRGGGLGRVQDPAQQISRHDPGGPRPDVQAEGQVRLVVDLDRNPGPPDRTGGDQIGALAQQVGLEEGADLTVDGGIRQTAAGRDDVAADRAEAAGQGEDRRGRGVGEVQGRRDDGGRTPARAAQGQHAGGSGNGADGNSGGGGHRSPSSSRGGELCHACDVGQDDQDKICRKVRPVRRSGSRGDNTRGAGPDTDRWGTRHER